MTIAIRVAVRDWDYITPLALGDIRPEGFVLQLHRVDTLPDDLAATPEYDAAEVSMSRYCTRRANGRDDVVGVPHFLMRSFCHRCIITARTSPIRDLADLAGKRIGLTGWQDSGHVWTRALLRRAGVGIAEARWFVGRLTGAHPIVDRLSGYGRPGLIEASPEERPMMELLQTGELDAVLTPFMPPGFFEATSPFRQLLPEFRRAETEYFRQVGYVPGIHLLGVKSTVAGEHPWLPQALSDLFEQSARLWMEKRRKYAETTPWILDEFRQMALDLPASWNANGFLPNERMIGDFAAELHAQQLMSRQLTPRELFPDRQ